MAQAGTLATVTGRDLELRELTQRLTYGGLLEGLPTRQGNKRYLDHVVAEYRSAQHTPVFLLAPVETLIALPEGERYPFGEPATLPRITCIGRFRSRPTGKEDPILCYSELTIIWLQAEFALPIEQAVVTEISSISWDSLASNFEY